MNLKLVESVQRRPRLKRAVDHFKSCPRCGNRHLIPTLPDVICPRCAWNSYALKMEDEGVDGFLAREREFQASLRRSKLKLVPRDPNREPLVAISNPQSERGRPDADKENVS